MRAKRDKLSIMHEMLEVILKKGAGVGPTQLMYRANLSHDMLVEYLNEMKLKGLIEESKGRSGGRVYLLTDKGHLFLRDYKAVKGFMVSYGLL